MKIKIITANDKIMRHSLARKHFQTTRRRRRSRRCRRWRWRWRCVQSERGRWGNSGNWLITVMFAGIRLDRFTQRLTLNWAHLRVFLNGLSVGFFGVYSRGARALYSPGGDIIKIACKGFPIELCSCQGFGIRVSVNQLKGNSNYLKT